MIIGTAGHVDHGKTELIKALTGKDTDRLKEEKERGISIDIGFAPYRFPDGRLAGVIDVPGHEKFIHNMLAGIGGIDLVLMVIDANEGVMAQTREHLDILELLQIKKGLVVITKIDLVDEEWLEMVIEEVKDDLKGTFLEGSPIRTVSSKTGEGIEELKAAIYELASTLVERDVNAPLRIPIDRVFTVAGFGTVITGTIVGGAVTAGQNVEVLPPGKEYRVRGLQVFGSSIERAVAGQRVALNLAALDKGEVVRGSVVASPGYFQLTRYCDAKLKLLPTAARPLPNMAPVHFYLGTARVVARIRLLDSDELLPGKEGYVQCRLERPLVASRGDPFIIRSYSPMRTIGGGVILDERPGRHKRYKPEVILRLRELEKEDPLPFVLQKLNEVGWGTLKELAHLTKMGLKPMKEILNRAVREGLVTLREDLYITTDNFKRWEQTILKALERFHREKPLQFGMPRAHLAGFLPAKIPPRVYDALLEILVDNGEIVIQREVISRKGFSPAPTPDQQKILEEISAAFEKGAFAPPSTKELFSSLNVKKEEGDSLLDYLVQSGLLVKIGEDLYLHKNAYRRSLELLLEYYTMNKTITLAQYRDLLQSSRRYAQALLEHFDGCRYTRRVGDERIPLKLPELH